MSDDISQAFINSKEILKKCGISRATLNNYIKLGILPKPIVQKPKETIMTRTKKIGYFPQTVLQNIEMVKRLKKEGNSIENIAKKIKGITEQYDDASLTELKHKVRPISPRESLPSDIISLESKELKLTIEDIDMPAYLINYQFQVEWINKAAEEKIFNLSVRTIKDPESRNIFKLLFNWKLHNHVYNWEYLIEQHVSFLKSKYPKDFINTLFECISENEVLLLKKAYEKIPGVPKQLINQSVVNLIHPDTTVKETYWLYTTFFREGVFFLYVPAEKNVEGIIEFLTNRRVVINEILQQRMASLIHFCVLVADLQDSVRICTELPTEEYFELIHQIWSAMEDSFRKYYGIYGRHIGDGIVYYFLQEKNSNYVLNAIKCAIELRGKMLKLSNEWKMKKKWDTELYLNIGINEGHDYMSAIYVSTNIEFRAAGNALSYATYLSRIGSTGSILTTKHVINLLKEDERKSLRYGIFKNILGKKIFMENLFSRVRDLSYEDESKSEKIKDIVELPVTEIME